MKSGIRIVGLSLIFWLVLNLPAALAYKKVKTFILTPPETVLAGVTRIAVLDFESLGSTERKQDEKVDSAEKLAYQVLSEVLKKKEPQSDAINYGQNFTNYLIGQLLETDRGMKEIATGFLGMGKGREGKTLQQGTFTNVFEIIERNQMEQILKEQELGLSGLVDENQVISLGKMLGVQALIVGDVNYYHKHEDYQQEREQKKDGKKVKVKVKCQRREVKISIRARIISSESGQILGSTEQEEKLNESKCEDSFGSLPTMNEMIDKGLKNLSVRVANYFAPHFVLENYELEKVKTEQFKDKAEKAAELAEDLKIDAAFVIYKSIFDVDQYNPEVLYNLGIMHEVVGNFGKAEEFYTMASQMKEDGKYKDALKRIEKSVAFGENLAKIGIEIQEHNFSVSETDQARALAKKAKTKGKREQRYPVFTEPNNSSNVVTQVPGDLSFTVLGQQGDWFQIELLGGKTGFIHKTNVEIRN
jgi:TPR repeat protein